MSAPKLQGGVHGNAVVGPPGTPGASLTRDQLYFSTTYPNFANSPLPNFNDSVNCPPPNYCGIRKFVDTLPLPNTPNDLGQMLQVAVPDTNTFPGSDYYEIALVQYSQKLHTDLPATLLRGYVQTNYGTDVNGNNTVAPAAVNYLGPIIIAQSNRPVRVKFVNNLPSGAGGNLFLPVDTSVLGSGLGLANGASPYLQNRATIHMHGGNTPWISDGTPHQWTVPAGDWGNTNYQRGASVAFVPDMYFVNGQVVPQCATPVGTNCSGSDPSTLPAGAVNDPGPGALTFYYTNQQSARLLFYHDHSYGITRLNVYAGEASAYIIRDEVEGDLIHGTNNSGINPGLVQAIPAAEIPLVIQDKTFVPQNPASTTISSVAMLELGAGYTNPTISFTGGCAVEPVAQAVVDTITDPYGQLLVDAITGINIVSAGSGCTSDPVVTITDSTGTGAAAFASVATLSQQDPTWDSSLWGGYGNLWYPHVYMPNQWPSNPDGSGTNPMGRWDYASWFWPAFTASNYSVRGELPCPSETDPTQTCPGTPSVIDPAPITENNGAIHQGVGSTVSLTPEAFMDTPVINGTAYPTLTVDPKPYRFRVLSIGNERSFNLSWFIACGTGGYTPSATAYPCPTSQVPIASGTEVGMVPSVTTPGFPSYWPSDGRNGGVPDPASQGPSWIQIANEGGVLPAPAILPPMPISYEKNMRSVTVTNVQNVGLVLMSAERADVIVDFSKYAGKTLILYNDAPAPFPGFDSRLDYFTGDQDQTGTGGAPSTYAGFGPNTRTIMQVKVNAGTPQPYDPAPLNTLLPAAFAATQPVPVVPEPVYSKVYGQNFTGHYPTLQSTSLTFTPIGGTTPITVNYGWKTIQELFEYDYGRMNSTLGTELPFTNFNTQTTVPLGYVDPFTEDFYDSADVQGQPVGVAGDGSQIWMITHNGVDTHAIHFHLYNVQLLNRFGWDGSNRPPFPNELGWKDTVRMNPLEIDFVAMRPMSQGLPFPVPDSVRLLDVTKPAEARDQQMSNIDPWNNRASQINVLQPMGWEYVWHCHLLGHEENDMMRDQVFQVRPQTPSNLVAFNDGPGDIDLSFVDESSSATGFTLERATDDVFTQNVTDFDWPYAAGWMMPVGVSDTSAVAGTTYYYRVRSYKPDADYWSAVLGNQLPNLVSPWSGSVSVEMASPNLTSVTPADLFFPSTQYLNMSTALAVKVVNEGTASLNLNSATISGPNASDFAIATDTCTGSGVFKHCTLTVNFTPSAVGARSATLTLSFNDPTNPVFNVSLTGTGTLAIATITVPSLSVTYGSSAPTITPSVKGLVGGDTIASLGTIMCSTTFTGASTVAGSPYKASCTGAANANYNIVYVNGSITVTPAALTVSASNQTMTYGSSLPTLTGTLSGVVNGDGITASYSTTATSSSPVGSYPITASLNDPNSKLSNYAVTNNAGTLTVTKIMPTVTWTNPAAITYGTPLSTIQLNAILSVAGKCVYTPAAGTVLSAGTQTLSVLCTPADTTNYATPAATTVTLTVNKAAPTVTLVASAKTLNYGSTLTLTATLSAGTTGTVNFQDTYNGVTSIIGSGTITNNIAQLAINTLGNGSHTMKAIYGGDLNNNSATSQAVTVTVGQVSPITGLSVSSVSISYGTTDTFTATLPSTATGSVTFKDGNVVIGTSVVSNGKATLTYNQLKVGQHPVSATYSGDTNYKGATSSVITVTVSKGLPTVTLTSSLNPSKHGNKVTFTVKVAVPSGLTPPTGTAVIKDSTATLGTVTLVSGVASYSTATLTTGSHSISVTYSGDANYLSAKSNTLVQKVN